MLSKRITITIRDYSTTLSSKISLYTDDEIDLIFNIQEFGIVVQKGRATARMMPLTALSAKLLIKTPVGFDSVESVKVVDDDIIFRITSAHTQYVGISKMQIVLYDADGCKITTPEFDFEVKPNIHERESDEPEVYPSGGSLAGNLKIVNTIEDMYKLVSPRNGTLCYVVEDKLYYTRKDAKWEPFKGGALERDIIVKGVSVGNLNDGDILTQGSTLTELAERMLIKQIPPNYVEPTLDLSSNSGLKIEIGKPIKPTILAQYHKNDAGNLTAYRLLKDGSVIKNTASIEAHTEAFTLTKDVHYRAEVDYVAGPIKDDNLGTPYPQGQIPARTITKDITITAARAFWGYASDSAAVPTAQDIRQMAISGIDLRAGATVKATAKASTRTIIFAYPATIKDCNKIRYEELGDDANKSAFKEITLSIPDASGHNPVDYRVYYYTSLVSLGATATFTLTV